MNLHKLDTYWLIPLSKQTSPLAERDKTMTQYDVNIMGAKRSQQIERSFVYVHVYGSEEDLS